MVDILLVDVWGGEHLYPPLSLGYLASIARNNGFSVSILEPNSIENFDIKIFKKILEEEDPTFCGFSGYTMEISNAYRMIDIVKEVSSKCITLLGGPHPTAIGMETFDENKNIDIIFFGEGEESFNDFLKNFNKPQKVKGIAFRHNGKKIKTEPRPFIEDLDSIPYPARDLFSTNYKGDTMYEKRPVGILISSRGCPFNCNFCNKAVFGYKFRQRSVQNVMGEIDEMINVYGMNEIFFIEDNFGLNESWVKEFCKEYKRRFDKPWRCLMRVNAVSLDTLKMMENAGCHTISIGVESGSEKVLKWIDKGLTKQQLREGFKIIRKTGLNIEGFFIIGHRIDTKKTIMETIEFAKELNPDFPRFFIFSPYPGSRVFDELPEKEKYKYWLKGIEPKLRSTKPISICKLSPEELVELWHRAYEEFYTNPKYLLRNVIPHFIREPFNRLCYKKLVNWVGAGVFRMHRVLYRE
ncbi:MAG: radical SAM protein [Candidatus Aenigmarchaeota archaeon]|nr:radical SAM protein [Candidatus Aenigmarchaeota archaeon]